jgi:hypothetical protein
VIQLANGIQLGPISEGFGSCPTSVSSTVLRTVAAAPSPGQHEFASLEAWLSAPPTLQLPLHQVECQQEQKGRELQRLLLQAHIQQRGHGNLGRALCVTQDGQQPTLYSRRRLHTRVLKSIFGPIENTRMGYCRAGTESIHPLVQVLQLPARSFSYELQKRMWRLLMARASP